MKRRALAWLSACSLAGCAVGPDYHGPPAEEKAAPAHYKNTSPDRRWKVAEPSEAEAGGAWWRRFHDRALEGYIDQALAKNPDLRLAAARISEARALNRVAAADFYPQVALNANALRQRTTNTAPIQRAGLIGANPFGATAAPSTTGGADTASSSAGEQSLATQPLSTTTDLFRAPLDLNWELDLFGRVRRSTEAARAAAQAAAADYRNMALSLSANVAVNYFTLRALDTEAAVIERTVKSGRESLQIAEERLHAGLTNELDVARARAELASNEASLAALARTRDQVENALATLIGEPASVLRIPARPLTSEALPIVPAGLPSELLERRPDIARAERQLAAANARIGVAKAAFFPRLSLTGSAGFESAEIEQLFNWESRIWEIAGGLVQPVFQGGRNVANLQAAQARYQQAVATYRGQVLRGFQEVEDALGDLRHLADQASAQDRAVAAARRSYELSQQQYQRGLVSFLDPLDAERTLLANERVSAQLLGQRFQASVQLIKALGGAWK